MNIRKVIQKDTLCLSLTSRDKPAIITELVDLLVASGKITDRKAALKAVLEREKKMTTGMHHGLAIPHGKTDTVEALYAAVGLIPEGVDFDSQDGEPTRIIILTISPSHRAGPHIQFLAELSRLMNREDVRRDVLNAGSVDELYEILTTR
ncbi:PTS sugar transporter subunit IIA [Kiritimatiellota bacterium B12222]|nr:PTS sugar transporter subunit IIA [Kiritimatiellota bacterium B12222]